ALPAGVSPKRPMKRDEASATGPVKQHPVEQSRWGTFPNVRERSPRLGSAAVNHRRLASGAVTDRLFRRPADAGEHRQHRVNLRLASSEHAAVRQAAARTRETVTGYAARIVVMAAAGHLDAGADPAEVRELIYWLVQIRNELNQA